MYLKQIPIGPMDNFAYLVGDCKTKECLAVDPAWDAEVILKEAQQDGMKVIGVLLTHTHYDHANALGNLIKSAPGKVYVHSAEADFVKEAGEAIVKTKDGDKINVGAVQITCLHTPGHTPGAQCYLVESKDGSGPQKYLISGDTLFVNACGRCDLPGGDAGQLYDSLSRLATLGDDVVVMPGHDYGDTPVSSIGRERKHNPYYQMRSREDFVRGRQR